MAKLNIKPVLRPNKITKTGYIPVFYRFTKNRKTTYISAGIACKINEWNEFDNRLWERRPTLQYLKDRGVSLQHYGEEGLKEYCKNVSINPLAKKYNAEIDAKLSKYEGEKTRLTFLSKDVSSKSFKKHLTVEELDKKELSFIDYWKKRIEQFDASEAISSADTYRDVLKFFEKFTRGKDLAFSDITTDFVEELTSYMKRQRKKNGDPFSQDYMYKIYKTVRALFNHAVDAEVYESKSDPFRLQNIQPQGSSHKERLDEKELNKLINLKLEKGSAIWNARNAFVFAVLNGGTRISDVLLIRWKNITPDNRITYSMKKTKDQSSLPLHPLAAKILTLYDISLKSKSSAFIFPFMQGLENETDAKVLQMKIESKTTLINSNLKVVAEHAKIKKNITTHIARHTYAALTIRYNANPMVTKKVLRHKKFETTQGYIGELNSELVDDVHLATLANLNSEIE
jgi:integrase/recombinase XerD